jgi:hypothetical protein
VNGKTNSINKRKRERAIQGKRKNGEVKDETD